MRKPVEMERGTFCIVSPIRDGGRLAQAIGQAERRLEEANIPFQSPKIGRHITFVPPFKATELEMHWLAAGLECARTFYSSEGVPRMARGVGLDFFRGEPGGVDALIVRLAINQNIKDLVERFRAMVPRRTEWLYPPKNYLVNFHATIAEGEWLQRTIHYLQKDEDTSDIKLFEGIDFKQAVQLEPPMLFEKKDGRWVLWRM